MRLPMLAIAVSAALGCAAAAGPAPAAPAADLCLTGGQVVDPDARTITRADVVIAGATIAAVGPAAGRACPGRRLELAGAYVMPGLIDAHVHGWGNPAPDDEAHDEEPGRDGVAALVLGAGVMATLDLGGDNQQRLALRARLAGSREHAALLVGGVVFPRRRGRQAAGGEDELRARVRALAAQKPEVVKVFPFAGGYEIVIDEARRLGLTTVVHIESWAQARAAVLAGASAITHFDDEEVIPDDLPALMARRGTRAIPTMAVQCDLANLVERPALLDDPLLARVTGPRLRAAYRDPAAFSAKAREWLRWQREECVANDFPTLRRLHAAGVKLLAGADTGNLGTFQGYSVHREMELMVAAGVPAWDALAAATTEAARFLRLPWGVRPGAPANLLVVNGSPVEDIRHTRRIAHVLYRGRLLGPPQPAGKVTTKVAPGASDGGASSSVPR